MLTDGKRGCSKDKPRPAGAPPQGRLKKDILVVHQANASGSGIVNVPFVHSEPLLNTYLLFFAVAGQDLDEYTHIFDNDLLTDEILWELDQLKQQNQISGTFLLLCASSQPHLDLETRKPSENGTSTLGGCPCSQGLAKEQLEEATKSPKFVCVCITRIYIVYSYRQF